MLDWAAGANGDVRSGGREVAQSVDDVDGMREVLDWYCDLLEVRPSKELYGFLAAEYEEELQVPAELPSVSMRRIGVDCLREFGDGFIPVEWLEAAKQNPTLAAVYA